MHGGKMVIRDLWSSELSAHSGQASGGQVTPAKQWYKGHKELKI